MGPGDPQPPPMNLPPPPPPQVLFFDEFTHHLGPGQQFKDGGEVDEVRQRFQHEVRPFLVLLHVDSITAADHDAWQDREKYS